MSVEPERNVEKILRSYAKHRRAEAASIPELHPATRQMLRDEAARTWRGRESAAAEKFSGSLWMRLGFAGAVCALLVGVVVFMRPGRNNTDLAKNEKPSDAAPSANFSRVESNRELKQAAPATAPPIKKPSASGQLAKALPYADVAPQSKVTVTAMSAADVAQKDTAAPRGQLRFSAPSEKKLLASFDSLSGNSPRRAPEMITRPEPLYGIYTELPSTSFQLAENNQSSKAVEEMTRQLVEAARMQRAGAAGGGQNKPAQTPLTQQAVQRARFRQTAVVADKPQVMNSFAIEQTGRQIRIVEDDGSVYEGQITAAVAPAPQAVEATAPVAQAFKMKADATTAKGQAAKAPAPPAPELVPFVAFGFNRTLGQAVTFRGSFESSLGPEAQTLSADRKLENQLQFSKSNSATVNQQSANAVPATNAVLYLGGTFTESTAAGQAQQPQQSNQGAVVGGIRGKAMVGGSVEVEIRALPEKP